MKKLLFSITLFVFVSVSAAIGKSYDIEDIPNAKSVWKYPLNINWKEMDTVKFGRYVQSDHNNDDEIEWFVVKKEKGKALLLSKYCLEKLKFHQKQPMENTSWEYSWLREFLNGMFYDSAFNEIEKSKILSAEVTNDGQLYSDNKTIDKVFILSESELYYYFGNFYKNTSKMESKGTNVANTSGEGVVNGYWLRTTGALTNEYYTKFKAFDFAPIKFGPIASIDVKWATGVRPAIWVSSENLLYDEEIEHESLNNETNNINSDEQESTAKTISTEETILEETTSRKAIVSETTTKETSKAKNNENVLETTTRNKIVPEETTKKENIKRKDYNNTNNTWMYWYIDGTTIHFSSKKSNANHDDKGIYYKTAYNTKSNGECFDNDGNMIGPSAEQRKMITKAIFDDKIDALYCSGLFNHYENLVEIENLKYFNTKNVKSMGVMFQHCHSLLSIDLSNFDTKNVTSMGAMFNNCKSLTELDLTKFDTRNVKNMGGMFNLCEKLKTIYVSKQFTTNNVTAGNGGNIDGSDNLFDNCKSLVGGSGTKYNKDHTGKEYARIDTANKPGYFTSK